MLSRIWGKVHRVCLKLHSVTDMEITLRMDHSQMSPPSSSAGSHSSSSSQLQRWGCHSITTVQRVSGPPSSSHTWLDRNGDRMVKKSFLWVKKQHRKARSAPWTAEQRVIPVFQSRINSMGTIFTVCSLSHRSRKRKQVELRKREEEN